MSDEDDDIEQFYRQIEVSHGSISNQTSIYASSMTSETKTSCCYDVIIVLVIFFLVVLTISFACDSVPVLSEYLQRLYILKVEVLVALFVITAVLLVVLFLRCRRQDTCKHWFNSFRYVAINRNTNINYADSFNDSTESIRNSQRTLSRPVLAQRRLSDPSPRVHELSADGLANLKRVLGMFVSYHDENDWVFLPHSQHPCWEHRQQAKVRVTMKLILVGNPSVGKTSIFHRILYDSFADYYMATLGVDLGIVTISLFPDKEDDNVLITLQIWDVSGSEKFSQLSHIIYKDGVAYIVVSDLQDAEYVDYDVIPWVRDIQTFAFQPYISLFFNKTDKLERTVTPVLGSDLYTFSTYAGSAKTGEGVVDNLIDVVAKSLLHEAEAGGG